MRTGMVLKWGETAVSPRVSGPVSRVLSPRGGGDHLSGTMVAHRLKRPNPGNRRVASSPPVWSCSGRGLPSQPVTRLLVGSYPTFAPLPDTEWILAPVGPRLFRQAETPCRDAFWRGDGAMSVSGGIFLWHYPRGFPHWALPSVLLYGARTFLRAEEAPRSPVPLTLSVYQP